MRHQISTHEGSEAWADRKVVSVGEHFIAKYSRYSDQIDGETLLLIEQNLQIPAPRLYAMWKEPDGKLYLVMEYLQGDTLGFLWPNLQEPDKDLIFSKLRAVFNQVNAKGNKRHSYLADFFENYQLLLDLAKNRRTPVFTRSDLQMESILVGEISSQESSNGKDYDVSTVDWESAGWYPSYREYVAAFFAFKWDND